MDEQHKTKKLKHNISELVSTKRAIMDEQHKTKKLKRNISELVDVVTTYYKGKYGTVTERSSFTSVLNKVNTLNRALVDKEAMETMSPNTREKYTKLLKSRRRRLVEQMRELVENEENNA